MIDVEQLKQDVDLPALVAKTVPLKKRGRVLLGRCPFHSEKTPSFVVYTKNFHCFGCGERGDAIDWIQKRYSVDWNQAVDMLGGRKPFDPAKPPLKREKQHAFVDPLPVWERYAEAMEARQIPMLKHHAAELGVLTASLIYLDAVWDSDQSAWAFPQRDATGKMIGLRYRAPNGKKWALTGGRAGLFIPGDVFPPEETLFIAEGPTDTAALITLEAYAIGRPSCLGQEDMVRDFIKARGIRRAVIVSDNDTKKTKADGSAFYPGIEGARRLQEELSVPTCIWIPEAKDVREWLQNGGTPTMLRQATQNLIWEKKK